MIAVRKLFLTSAAVTLAVGGLLVGGSTAALAADTDTATAADAAASESPAPETVDEADESAEIETLTEDTLYDSANTPNAAVAAYSNLSISPAGPYSGGESVTLKAGGFEPNEQLVLSICIGGQRLAGPQDCAPLNGSSSAVGAANASGNASLEIKVLKGELGAQSKPGHVCGNGSSESCVFSLTNFSGKGPDAVRVTYKEDAAAASGTPASSSGSKKKGNKSTPSAADDDSTSDTADDGGAAATGTGDSTSGGAEIANTGAGSAAAAATLGAAFLGLGLALTMIGRRRRSVGFARS
jgi:hypothetical protein